MRGPVITALSRTGFQDVDRAWEAVQHAERPRIHVFIATSPIHMAKKLRMTEEQVKAEVVAAVARARSYCADVEFSPEDGSRSEVDFMCDVLQAAVDQGATTLNIPDTVGYGVPEEYGKLIAHIVGTVHGDYVISTHCHNDLGLAVANSLAGVQAGARQVECAINGLGERAGNAALEEIVMAVRTRSDYFGGVQTGVRTEELARTSRVVSRLTGYPVQYNKAVVGRNAFAHEAGIHQHGVLEDRETYEIIDASTVGQEAAQIVLGKHSGRHAFSRLARQDGPAPPGRRAEPGVRPVQGAGRPQARSSPTPTWRRSSPRSSAPAPCTGTRWPSLDVHGGTQATPVATRRADRRRRQGRGRGGRQRHDRRGDRGDRPGDRRDRHASVDFKVSSVTGGGDALGDVIIQLEAEGHTAAGRGVATDVVEASGRAYLNAVNKLVRLRDGRPRERTVGP